MIWLALLCISLGATYWKLRWRVFPTVGLILCLMVVISFLVTHNHYTRQPFIRGPGTVQGVVRGVTFNDAGRASVTLANVRVEGQSINGRVRLFVPLMRNNVLAVGDVIRAHTNLHRPFDSGSSFNVNNRIRYQGSALQGNIYVVRQSNDLRSTILRYTNGFFHQYMSEDSAELMYSMLFGDRSELGEEIRESFTLTGLAHVLAVSGLHVGLIVAILLWILKFFKAGKKTQFIVILLTLILYVYMADFRYSIMRASIMFLILLFNRLFLRRIETISSISLAAIIILILFPHSILSLSFQLSFACLIGIALFYRPISGWLEKKVFTPVQPWWVDKFRKGLVTGLTLYLVTAITTFPLLVGTFGYFPLIGLIANVLLLPIIILAFQMSVIALVTWVGFPLLWVVDRMIWLVLRVSDWLAAISWQRLEITQQGFWYLFYFLALILLTRFIFIKKKTSRYLAAGILLSIYAISLLVQIQ